MRHAYFPGRPVISWLRRVVNGYPQESLLFSVGAVELGE